MSLMRNNKYKVVSYVVEIIPMGNFAMQNTSQEEWGWRQRWDVYRWDDNSSENWNLNGWEDERWELYGWKDERWELYGWDVDRASIGGGNGNRGGLAANVMSMVEKEIAIIKANMVQR
ncbi:uncharacterized protein HKW66_Vig0006470 [Vigna angularis]|uniref:Uncharacterized protein n=1 Tax=Phaseolus angularis TaxID=3914 RepID=A0A8T0LEE3_PHAAN|nr:uncharacterized protein HKW66_Vig0006470 [Vigna angularis]